jgi:hypothetical protein
MQINNLKLTFLFNLKMQSVERPIAFVIEIKDSESSNKGSRKRATALEQRLAQSHERPSATLADIEEKLAKAEAKRQKLLQSTTEKAKRKDVREKRKAIELTFAQRVSEKLEKESVRVEENRASAINRKIERLNGHHRQVEERCTRKQKEPELAQLKKEELMNRLAVAEKRRADHIEELKNRARKAAAAKKFTPAAQEAAAGQED